MRKYFTVMLCIVGTCLAIFGGIYFASNYIISDVVPEDAIELPEATKDRANILILGSDKSGTRTDTIMLASLDFKNKSAALMSIPRDTRIVHKGNYDKITHCFSYDGGVENTINAVKQITGIPIHYYAVITNKAFRDAIDALGGVYVDVPHVPNKFSNGRKGMYYDDPVQDLHIALSKGYQLLDGEQAEGYVRFRDGYADADLHRIEVQQGFVMSLIEQKLQPTYIAKASGIYKDVIENVKTNYTLSAATSHLSSLSKMDFENFTTMSLPGYATNAYTVNGYASCFIYDIAETEEMMEEYFGLVEAE